LGHAPAHARPAHKSEAALLHQPLQFRAACFGPANFVDVETEVFPAALAAVPAEFLFLAVRTLLQHADSDVNGDVHKGLVKCKQRPRKVLPIFHENQQVLNAQKGGAFMNTRFQGQNR
jgi:hypothetical protein